MELKVITPEDLKEFRAQLLEDIKELLQYKEQPKKWLRGSEVRKLLKISAGSLQNLRINGTLHPVKLPGTNLWFYDANEINSLFEQER
jgi:hypothetical protein